MTEIEKRIIRSLASVGKLVSELSDSHMTMAKFIAERLPGLQDAERRGLLEQAQKSKLQVQSFRESVEKLQAALKD